MESRGNEGSRSQPLSTTYFTFNRQSTSTDCPMHNNTDQIHIYHRLKQWYKNCLYKRHCYTTSCAIIPANKRWMDGWIFPQCWYWTKFVAKKDRAELVYMHSPNRSSTLPLEKAAPLANKAKWWSRIITVKNRCAATANPSETAFPVCSLYSD